MGSYWMREYLARLFGWRPIMKDRAEGSDLYCTPSMCWQSPSLTPSTGLIVLQAVLIRTAPQVCMHVSHLLMKQRCLPQTFKRMNVGGKHVANNLFCIYMYCIYISCIASVWGRTDGPPHIHHHRPPRSHVELRFIQYSYRATMRCSLLTYCNYYWRERCR